MSEFQNRLNHFLWQLMHGLLYPAVLGTLIICLMQKIASEPAVRWYENREDLFAIVGVLFFCISYCNFFTISGKDYSVLLFLFDIGEIVLMFVMFFALRLFALDHSVPSNMRSFYTSVAVVPLIELMWRCVKAKSIWSMVNYTGLLSVVVAAFLFYMSTSRPIFSDGIAILVVFVAVAVYAIWLFSTNLTRVQAEKS